MVTIYLTLLLFALTASLKTWIPNTDINNELNWDKNDTPKDCDNISFQRQAGVAAFWNLKRVIIIGLTLPETGDVIFSRNVYIQFKSKEKCPNSRELKYIRHEIKGWLDPDNWKSDSQSQWLPHSERVPCAGEAIVFPPQRTFAVQLPSILTPAGDITFDDEVFRGDSWSEFLKTELGFQLFRGPDDLRNTPWRNDWGCSNNKKCICGRSSYSIRDGIYKETDPRIFEEAVCLYAMPKCKPSACYSPVVPEGHCCGICGAVIKIEDNTKEGYNISIIKAKVLAETEKFDSKKKLKTYVGRTKDENIQIVIVADNSGDTIKSHTLANIIKAEFTNQRFQAKISLRVSGLRFSNYLFNSVSGVVFSTLVAVLIFFVSIYYTYLVLPKKGFQSSSGGNLFMFARFENTVNENLEIGVEAEPSQELPQAFDNPMYSGSSAELPEENSDSKSTNKSNIKTTEAAPVLESTTSKEYSNPMFSDFEETKKPNEFLDNLKNDEEDFNEIKF